MKIANFTDTYKPQINGVVTSIDLFSEELRKRGHEVHIFCPRDKNLQENQFVHTLPSFKFRPYPEYRVGLPSFAPIAFLRRLKPDVIHVHSPAPIGLLGMAMAKRLKIPVVMTYHTLLTEYYKYFPGYRITETNVKKFIKKYSNWFFNKANVLIVPSEDTKALLRRSGVKAKIEVLPTGIKIEKRKINKASGKPYFLFVGRLCKEKSIDVLIRAFKNLERKINYSLIITSSGPAERELKSLVKKLRLESRVKFTGYISEEEKWRLYSGAEAFATASETDTQAIVLLEAMSVGTPVIAPNKGGIKNYVKDKENGLIFRSGDVKDLEKKMLRIIKDEKLRKKLIKNGFRTVEELSIGNCTKHLEKIYRDVIETLKVSIVIPTYMEEKYIEKTLKALRNQTYKNYEIIIVDSASKDRTVKIAKKYSDKIIVTKERGIGKARNTGARMADGDILLFLDADTVLKENFIKRMIDNFRSQDVIGVCGYVKTTGSLVNRLTYRACSELAWLSTLIEGPLFYGMCMAWDRGVFEKIGGFKESMVTAEDIELTQRASKYGKCVLARDAVAVTSPRRVTKQGWWSAVAFHIKNFFKYIIFKRPEKYYPTVR